MATEQEIRQQELELEKAAKAEGDPAKRPNAPRGAKSREDMYKEADERTEANPDFRDVADEEHDKITEIVEEPVETEVKAVPEKKEQTKKYALKVNGKDIELTEEELIARVQKGEAADQRFQEAAQLKREAEELKAQLPAKDVAKPEVTDDDLAEARRLQMGSEEEAAAVIKSLRRPSLNEADVNRKIDERLTFTTSVERFKTEYSERFADPYLSKLVALRDEELVKAGDKRSYYDRYKAIGDEIREWKGVKPNIKQERKASITVLPTASQRATGAQEEDEEQS